MPRPSALFRQSLLPVGLLLACLPTLFPQAASPVVPPAGATRLIPASDPRFRYEGRFDDTNPTGPVVVWQGSRIRIDFTGNQLVLRFDGLDGQNFFDMQVDDRAVVLAVPPGADQRLVFPQSLGGGNHRLMLFKRSEASAGTVRFRGIELAPGGEVAAPPPSGYRLAMEFIGDSITVGACDEDGAADQWADRRTHNNALSYGALTAAAFDADYRNIAVSGMGVAIGWQPFRAAEIWDRVYPNPRSPRADLAAWTPDVVFVNLGENDDSFTRAKHLPFPVNFAAEYVALVRAVRRAHPATTIVLLRGGMWGGTQSPELQAAWTAVVAALERTDPRVAHFVFQHWSSNHPRISDHRAMANELIAWLKRQAFLPVPLDGR